MLLRKLPWTDPVNVVRAVHHHALVSGCILLLLLRIVVALCCNAFRLTVTTSYYYAAGRAEIVSVFQKATRKERWQNVSLDLQFLYVAYSTTEKSQRIETNNTSVGFKALVHQAVNTIRLNKWPIPRIGKKWAVLCHGSALEQASSTTPTDVSYVTYRFHFSSSFC